MFAKNNKRGRRFARFTQRAAKRGQRLAGASNSKIFTNLLDQPLPIASDLVTQRRFEAIVGAITPDSMTVSTKSLIDTLPGGSSLWDKVQFHRFDIFSNAEPMPGVYAPLTVTLSNPASGYFGDVPTGYADSVAGARRAHLAIKPNELFCETWIDSADTSPLMTITCRGEESSSALVQFVCVLRSTAGVVAVHTVPATVTDPRHQP